MLRLAFDFIITWRETRTRPNAYLIPKRSAVVDLQSSAIVKNFISFPPYL